MGEVTAILNGERDWLANLANFTALLATHLADINWVGFYLWRNGQLVLGPFHGLPACTRIPIGRGVCGACAERRRTVVVPDVQSFPRHIACDSRSRSEIVIPLLSSGQLLGVLDVDSPILSRFREEDRFVLESVTAHLVRATDWPDFLGRH